MKLKMSELMGMLMPDRKCCKCKAPVEAERVKLLNSNLCASCAHELEQKLAAKNGGPLIHRATLRRQEEFKFNEIHVPREWEEPKRRKKKKGVTLVPALMPDSQRILDERRRAKCLITVVYDD
jgi:hypothetical protein